jgi:protease-4
MLENLILQEIFSTQLMLRDTGLFAVERLVENLIAGKRETTADASETKNISLAFLPRFEDPEVNPYDGFEENSVAVIPLTGTMFKYGGWYYSGCDDLAEYIRAADQSSRICGTLLLVNTPGGTTQSIIQMEDALRNRTKPSVALIDYQCCSAGIYVSSFCDEIYAMNRMCEVGSIGTFATFVDESEALKKWGYKIVQIYPPESKYKNLSYREALEGKPERLIREELTPFAIHFQNLIKENRKKTDTSVEGILEGRVFYAYEAVENGLIDGIMNMEQTVSRVRELAKKQQDIYSPFKNK